MLQADARAHQVLLLVHHLDGEIPLKVVHGIVGNVEGILVIPTNLGSGEEGGDRHTVR